MAVSATLNQIFRKLPPWLIYLLGFALPIWLFWRASTGALGVDPVKAIEHRLGEVGLWVLMASLAVTPLHRLTRISLIRLRRAFGLTGFFLIFLHFLCWAVLDVQLVSAIFDDILKRPYITIGMASFILMIPLAITSNNASIRMLGTIKWRKLHRLSYLAITLGAVHFVMLGKLWQLDAILYLSVVIFLLAYRLFTRK